MISNLIAALGCCDSESEQVETIKSYIDSGKVRTFKVAEMGACLFLLKNREDCESLDDFEALGIAPDKMIHLKGREDFRMLFGMIFELIGESDDEGKSENGSEKESNRSS